jgi:hypothetical protein
MKRVALAIAIAALTVTAPVKAQTVAELLTVAAISATLDSNVKLPSGAFFVTNPKYAAAFAGQLKDASSWTNYNLYVAKGIATKLADNYIGDLKTSFAVAGYFEGASSSQTVGAEVRTRTEFSNDANGKTMLLYVVKRADGVYFLIGQKK